MPHALCGHFGLSQRFCLCDASPERESGGNWLKPAAVAYGLRAGNWHDHADFRHGCSKENYMTCLIAASISALDMAPSFFAAILPWRSTITVNGRPALSLPSAFISSTPLPTPASSTR